MTSFSIEKFELLLDHQRQTDQESDIFGFNGNEVLYAEWEKTLREARIGLSQPTVDETKIVEWRRKMAAFSREANQNTTAYKTKSWQKKETIGRWGENFFTALAIADVGLAAGGIGMLGLAAVGGATALTAGGAGLLKGAGIVAGGMAAGGATYGTIEAAKQLTELEMNQREEIDLKRIDRTVREGYKMGASMSLALIGSANVPHLANQALSSVAGVSTTESVAGQMIVQGATGASFGGQEGLFSSLLNNEGWEEAATRVGWGIAIGGAFGMSLGLLSKSSSGLKSTLSDNEKVFQPTDQRTVTEHVYELDLKWPQASETQTVKIMTTELVPPDLPFRSTATYLRLSLPAREANPGIVRGDGFLGKGSSGAFFWKKGERMGIKVFYNSPHPDAPIIETPQDTMIKTAILRKLKIRTVGVSGEQEVFVMDAPPSAGPFKPKVAYKGVKMEALPPEQYTDSLSDLHPLARYAARRQLDQIMRRVEAHGLDFLDSSPQFLVHRLTGRVVVIDPGNLFVRDISLFEKNFLKGLPYSTLTRQSPPLTDMHPDDPYNAFGGGVRFGAD